MPSRTKQSRSTLDRHSEHRQKILEALNLRDEFQTLGVRLKGEPSSDGWMQCHAFDREDRTPSASVNIETGRYIDFGQEGKSMSIFDVWMYKNNGSFADAIKHFEQKTGITSASGKTNPNKGVILKNIGGDEKIWLVENKPPISREGFDAVGGGKIHEPDYGDCANVPIWGSELDAVPPIGHVIYNWYRGDLNGVKNRTTKGTTSGMVGLHGLQLIRDKKAETVYVTEGITDLMALQSVIPQEKWHSVAVVTHSNGAGEFPDAWKMQFFVEQNVVVIPDADTPGMDGGKKWAEAIAQVAKSVRFVPLYGDLQLNLQAAHSEFVDFDMLKEALENHDDGKAPAAFAELKNFLMQWNWKTKSKPEKDIVVTLLAALAAASFIQSTFKFRPLVCISGESQSGKSDIQTELLVPLFGALAEQQQKPSEAAIRQSVEGNSKIMMIDELEKNKYRAEILKLLRTSTDGGLITRGTTHQKVIKFGLKHIVWISSIEMNLANLADASRFFQFEPQRPERKDGKRPLLKLDPQAIKKIGFALMVFAIKNMQSLLQTVKTLSEEDIEQASPRNIEAAAVPAAFAEKLSGWQREETHAFMYFSIHENSPQKNTDVTEDHENLLQVILCQTIRVTNFGELSIAQTIKKAIDISTYNPDIVYANEALERHGIKIVKNHNSNREVFFKPSTIDETLLKNPEWKGTNIKQLLARIEGAKDITARFYGKTVRGISIPIESIIGTETSDQSGEPEQF